MSDNDSKEARIEAPGRIIATAIVILAGAVLYSIGIAAKGGYMSDSSEEVGGVFMFIGGVLFSMEYVMSFVRDRNSIQQRKSRKLPPPK